MHLISYKHPRLKTLFVFAVTLVILLILHWIGVNSHSPNPNTQSLPKFASVPPSNWANVAIGGGGYVTGIYLHPLEKNLIYIRTDVGGFYRWNQNDESWLPLTEQFRLEYSNYQSGEALAVDPKNSDVIYIAAGKYTADWSKQLGAIFKSNDRGQSWKKMGLELPMGGNENKRWAGERLAIDPHDSNTILFASRLNGLWKSENAGRTWSNVEDFSGNSDPKLGITTVIFDNKIPGVAYAAAFGDGIYQTLDSGDNWRPIKGPPKANRLAIKDSILYVTHDAGVSKLRSAVWEDITPSKVPEVFCAISINPSNHNDLLVASGETTETKIYHSFNGGTTWNIQKVTHKQTVPWWSSFMLKNPWIASIEFDPLVANRVWFTDWYGVWRTENVYDEQPVWKNYEKGHEELVVFSLISPPNGGVLLSGVADVDGFLHDKGLNGYPSRTFGPGEPGDIFQDTYSIAYSENNPLRLVRVGSNREHSIHTGALSDDGGITWIPFKSWNFKDMPLRVSISATDPNSFVVINSESSALLTLDAGRSWIPVQGLPYGPKGPWYFSQPLTNDTIDGSVFYYYSKGRFYQSSDGGLSFQVINISLPTSDWCSIKALPGVRGDVWASFDEKGLYRSQNGGKAFSKLPTVERAHLFAFGKAAPGKRYSSIYVYGIIKGSGEGFYESLDLGKTWRKISTSSIGVSNDPLVMEASKQQYGLIFIGTGGRGIYYKAKRLDDPL